MNDPECNKFESEIALKIAKNNVEKYFAVVGIIERYEETLKLFEYYVPAFFKNARNVWKTNPKEDENSKNKWKWKTPNYIKDKIAENFTMELEFYEFCKQRFHQQLVALRL